MTDDSTPVTVLGLGAMGRALTEALTDGGHAAVASRHGQTDTVG